MKKVLLGVLFTLFTFFSYSQTIAYRDWQVENKGQWGSFYWGVTRTANVDINGKYYYYVYFTSNSFFNTKRDGYNYDKASTYIRDINIYMTEYKYINGGYYKYNTVILNLPYFTCDWNYDPQVYAAWFWSYSPKAQFDITFLKASAFDYSIYR